MVDTLAFTIDEAAEQLRVSRSKVEELLKREELAFVKIGTRTIIPRRAIEEYLRCNMEYRDGTPVGGLRSKRIMERG